MHQPVAELGDRFRRPAVSRSLQLGELAVSYVPDGAVQLDPHAWLPATTEDTWNKHSEYLDRTGNLVGSIGGLLVRHGDRALLIDAGFGPQNVEAQPGNPHGLIYGGALLDGLAELDVAASDIEAVAFTHLHIDHVGWAWLPSPGTEAPAFTAASYLVTETEWAQRELLVEAGTGHEVLDALDPRVHTIGDGEEIFPGVRVYLTQGHTAGHAVYVISAGKQRLIAFGDAMHSPVQVTHPEWAAVSDHDPRKSTQYRKRLVKELLAPDTIGFGTHFADVVFGRASLGDNGVGWQPIC